MNHAIVAGLPASPRGGQSDSGARKVDRASHSERRGLARPLRVMVSGDGSGRCPAVTCRVNTGGVAPL